jgi:hypothetical protein
VAVASPCGDGTIDHGHLQITVEDDCDIWNGFEKRAEDGLGLSQKVILLVEFLLQVAYGYGHVIPGGRSYRVCQRKGVWEHI